MNLLEPNPFYVTRFILKYVVKWEEKQYKKFKQK